MVFFGSHGVVRGNANPDTASGAGVIPGASHVARPVVLSDDSLHDSPTFLEAPWPSRTAETLGRIGGSARSRTQLLCFGGRGVPRTTDPWLALLRGPVKTPALAPGWGGVKPFAGPRCSRTQPALAASRAVLGPPAPHCRCRQSAFPVRQRTPLCPALTVCFPPRGGSVRWS